MCSPFSYLMLVVFVGSLAVVSRTQTNTPHASDSAAMRERIATIIRERLNEGVTVTNGVRVQTRTPPSSSTVEEIRRYGDDAVPVLTGYLNSKRIRERAIAVELLGLLGGSRIVGPLQKVIRYDPSPNIRILALRWITQAPKNLASPIIHKAATTDSDQHVREEAKSLLTTYGF